MILKKIDAQVTFIAVLLGKQIVLQCILLFPLKFGLMLFQYKATLIMAIFGVIISQLNTSACFLV